MWPREAGDVAGRSRKLASVPDEAAENARGLAAKVIETIGKLKLAPEDAALSALAVQYARTLDRCEAIAADARRMPFDPESADALEQLRKRVSAVAATSDLGPKLLASLDALGATPKARAAKGSPAPSAGSSRLSALRGELA
jgi:ribonuclease D